MQITAFELAEWLGGSVEGDGNVVLDHPARIDREDEGGPGSVSFVANPLYRKYLWKTRAAAVIVAGELELKEPVSVTLIRVEDPYTAFSKLLSRFEDFRKQEDRTGIDERAAVHKTATVDSTAYVGPCAVVEAGAEIGAEACVYGLAFVGKGAKIGARSIVHAGACIYDHCIVGADCIIHSGAAIGSDGFGFAPQPDGSFKKIPQTGNVVLEKAVEVGSNAAIDRATVGSTIIRSGAKIDNLVQIAHNVEIGAFTVLAAQSGVSGSTKLGTGCMVGGQAGFIGHLEIADGTRVNAQSGVNKSIPKPGSSVTGSPAGDYISELRSQVVYRNLPQLEKRIRDLESQLEKLNAAAGKKSAE